MNTGGLEAVRKTQKFLPKSFENQKRTEGVGFEPTVRVNAHTLSKRAP